MPTKSTTITPKSDYGAGFLPIMIRAWARTLIIANAVFRGWPVTNDITQAELTEATTYITNLADIHDRVSDNTNAAITEWREQLDALRVAFDFQLSTTPDSALAYLDPLLQQFTASTFALMARLDEDLLGLTRAETDPGKHL